MRRVLPESRISNRPLFGSGPPTSQSKVITDLSVYSIFCDNIFTNCSGEELDIYTVEDVGRITPIGKR